MNNNISDMVYRPIKLPGNIKRYRLDVNKINTLEDVKELLDGLNITIAISTDKDIKEDTRKALKYMNEV